MNLRGRQSPSGPKVDLQLPYYGAVGVDGTAPGTYYVALGLGAAVIDAPGVEDFTAYLIPQRGVLGTLLVRNTPGADAVNLTYQVRRNGVNVGSPVVIGNTTVGPVRVDLSSVGVSPNDLVSLRVTVPAFAGTAPVPKIVLTWSPAAN